MDIKPLRRIEHFLAKIAGSAYAKDLTPITRKEYWLNEIAKNGGGSGGAFFVTDNNDTLDKTWAEIYAASTSNIVVLRIGPDPWYMYTIAHSGETYSVSFFSSGAANRIYVTQSETDYPKKNNK